MSFNHLYVCLLASLFTAIGCSPTYYKPNLTNVPNFTEKGQSYVAAHLRYGGEVQAAYAITNHFAVLGNYETGKNTRTITYTPLFSTMPVTKTTTTKGALGEFAAGYFRPLGRQFTLGIYAGQGSGHIKNDWDTEGCSSAALKKTFLLATVGFVDDYNIEVISSAKLARLNYSNLTQTYTNQDYIDAFNVLKTPISIAEIGLTFRFGFKNIKCQMQGNWVHSLTTTTPLLKYEPFSIGLGISVHFNTHKKVVLSTSR